MGGDVRVPLAEASRVADELVAALRPSTERIEIAGSIRRGRADVGDIELVAVPKYREIRDGFFGESRANALDLAIDELIADGELTLHPTDPKRGERYSKLLHVASGLQVDLFSARAETFGVIFLIRTGSAGYSQAFVAGLRRRGWHVAAGELHRGGLGCVAQGCELVPAPEERDVYDLTGMPWVEPGDRA